MPTALISVSDKTGSEVLGHALNRLGWDVLSSGGTSDHLVREGVIVITTEQFTGIPSNIGGRVKTLHPKVHGSIMHIRNDPSHQADVAAYGYVNIDLVVCNLYPFGSNPSIGLIDVGGPTMLRSAAKNHAYVASVVDPGDYDMIISLLESNGEIDADTRRKLARKAFAHTAAYDAAITTWFDEQDEEELPETIHLTLERVGERLGYGENAWMTPAGTYLDITQRDDPLGFHQFQLVTGVPSYNNAVEIWERQLQTFTKLIVAQQEYMDESFFTAIGTKHGNCCGANWGEDPATVLKRMLEGDMRAIHGGLVMLNFTIDEELAEILLTWGQPVGKRRIIDAITAAGFTPGAVEMLRRKKDRCRLLANEHLIMIDESSLDVRRRLRHIRAGYAVQPNYTQILDLELFESFGAEYAEQAVWDMLMAWAIGSTSNSNTITIVLNGQLLANAVGQQDRVGAAELAIKRALDAGHSLKDAVVYSDSFMPYDDAIKILIAAGVKVFLTSSGSLTGDVPVKAAAIEAGVSLLWAPDALVRGFCAH